MISTTYKFILLHVPKTGGNSIQATLLPISDDTLIQNEHQDGHDRFAIKGPITPKKHALLSDYKTALKDKFFDYKVAITLRHPLQRAISYYHMPRRWIEIDETGAAKHIKPVWDKDNFLNLLTKIKPASDFLEVDGEYIQPDHRINLENLEGDFSQFCKACGLSFTGADLPHRNKSSYASGFRPDIDITPEIISAVKKKFARDFDMFGYD